MNADEWSSTQRWLYAIKPSSWPKLLVPMLLGQAAGVVAHGQVSVAAVLFGVVFTILDGLFIVLLNDWSDEPVDRIKREMFPDGCSPKTIPDGILRAGTVLAAGLLAGGGALLTTWWAGAALDRPHMLLGAAACLAVFVAYSLPPVRLNYRGGGELLEAIGVGLALPWLNAYAQSGQLWADGYALFFGFAILSLGSAIASGLSDEESDRIGGKRTFTTTFGNASARRATELSLGAGVGAWFVAALLGIVPWWCVVPAAIVVWLHARKVVATSGEARTNAFVAQKRYKGHLHHAIWFGGLTLSVSLLLAHVLA